MSNFSCSEPVNHANCCGCVRLNCHVATQTEVDQNCLQTHAFGCCPRHRCQFRLSTAQGEDSHSFGPRFHELATSRRAPNCKELGWNLGPKCGLSGHCHQSSYECEALGPPTLQPIRPSECFEVLHDRGHPLVMVAGQFGWGGADVCGQRGINL